MIGKAAKKAMRIARGTALTLGAAMMLALVLGVSTTALAGTGVGARFQLGKINTVNAITTLVGDVAGPSLRIDNNSADANATALDLQVEAGKAPMTVNSSAQVANLNSDKLDGKSVEQIGVNGLQKVTVNSSSNSDSPKTASASCPPGKVLVGSGYNIAGGKSGGSPNEETDIVIDAVEFGLTSVSVTANEEEPHSNSWVVTAFANCATAP